MRPKASKPIVGEQYAGDARCCSSRVRMPKRPPDLCTGPDLVQKARGRGLLLATAIRRYVDIPLQCAIPVFAAQPFEKPNR
jgi:hypothetical protein